MVNSILAVVVVVTTAVHVVVIGAGNRDGAGNRHLGFGTVGEPVRG